MGIRSKWKIKKHFYHFFQRIEAMNRLMRMLGLLCCVSVIGSAQAATIFSDDFSDTNQTKIKWVNPSSSLSMKFVNGSLTLTNSDATYTSFLVHSFPPAAKPSTFTLSAKITMPAPTTNGVGLMCCMDNTTALKGYTFLLGMGQSIFASKYTGTGSQSIYGSSNSFVNTVTNIIKVSKSVDTFWVYCNEHLITRFIDNQFTSGDIAIVVLPKMSVTVDDVVMTDQVQHPAEQSCFVDSFYNMALDGWDYTTLTNGPITIGAGKIAPTDTDTTYSSIIFTSGIYDNASMKAIVRHKSGPGMYGITFITVVRDSIHLIYKTYAFCVDSLRRYQIQYPDTPKVWKRPAQSFIYGALGTDTLEVLRYSKHYVFKVNGYDVGENIPIPLQYSVDGAGLYVGQKTTAEYTLFMVGGDSTSAKCAAGQPVFQRNVMRYQPVQYRYGSSNVVFNILGRKIGMYDWNSFVKARSVVAGPYIIVQKNDKNAAKPLSIIKLK